MISYFWAISPNSHSVTYFRTYSCPYLHSGAYFGTYLFSCFGPEARNLFSSRPSGSQIQGDIWQHQISNGDIAIVRTNPDVKHSKLGRND